MDKLPFEILAQRVARARDLMAERELAALVLYSAPRGLASATQTSGNVGYFAGWTPMWAPALLVIGPRGKPLVLATGFNERRLFNHRVEGFMEVATIGGRSMADAVADALDTLGVGQDARIGMAGRDDMPMRNGVGFDAFAGAIAVDKPIHDLRLLRHPVEVALHRRASEISDAMIAHAMEMAVRPNMTPGQLMAEVEYAGRSLGADVSRLWLATGETPPVTYFEAFEMPTTIGPRDRIQLGTMVSFEGHFSQGLRIGIRGGASQDLHAAMNTLLAIQDAALAAMVPGQPLHTVSDVIEAMIGDATPYDRTTDPFRFQSCHGLGLDYGEPALSRDLNANRDRSADAEGVLIAENMVMEIHPNYTIPGLGHVCAGDVAVVTADGGQWLTRYPRGLVLLD